MSKVFDTFLAAHRRQLTESATVYLLTALADYGVRWRKVFSTLEKAKAFIDDSPALSRAAARKSPGPAEWTRLRGDDFPTWSFDAGREFVYEIEELKSK